MSTSQTDGDVCPLAQNVVQLVHDIKGMYTCQATLHGWDVKQGHDSDKWRNLRSRKKTCYAPMRCQTACVRKARSVLREGNLPSAYASQGRPRMS